MLRPQANFNVAMKLLVPSYEEIKGVPTKIYPNPDDVSDNLIVFGDFKTYGGTEKTINDVHTIVDTAIVNTWFRPDITSECRIFVTATNKIYEIINEPENIEMRNQFLQFKLSKVGGKP